MTSLLLLPHKFPYFQPRQFHDFIKWLTTAVIGKSNIRIERTLAVTSWRCGFKMRRGPLEPRILSYFEMTYQPVEAFDRNSVILSLGYDFRDVKPCNCQRQERADSMFRFPEQLPLKWS
jgi:hypothetical protein